MVTRQSAKDPSRPVDDTDNAPSPNTTEALRKALAVRERELEQLRSDEELFRAACMNSPDYMVMVDRSRRFVWANRTHPGLSMAQVLAMRIDDFEDPDSLPHVIAAVNEGFATRQPVRWDATYSVHGARQYGTVRGVYMESRDCLLLVTTDTTAEVQARQALEAALTEQQRNRARLEAAQRIARLGEWEWSTDDEATHWSAEMYRIFGKDPATFRPSYDSYAALMAPADRERIRIAIRDAIEHGASFQLEHHVTGDDGVCRTVVCRGEPVIGPDGRVRQLRGSAQDVTDLRQIEASLRGALAEQALLLQELHHRVKNNLQLVASLLSLQAPAAAQASARQTLASCRGRVRTMALVHESLYRADGLAGVPLRGFLSTLANQVLASHGDATRHAIDVDVRADVNLPMDTGVPCGLIVHELLTNALTHGLPAPRRGRVEVRVQASPPNAVTIDVVDEGVGMSGKPEGLGLRIASTLANQIGARLTRSTELGTRIRLEIPLDP